MVWLGMHWVSSLLHSWNCFQHFITLGWNSYRASITDLSSLVQKNSLCTIRNNANISCVQFSTDSSHLLAFSAADYKTYCFDLRKVSTAWCILVGHEKAVSYAKFLDAGTLVSASTDNTLKIWDLSKTSSNCLSRDACILTLRGHTNEKVSHLWANLWNMETTSTRVGWRVLRSGTYQATMPDTPGHVFDMPRYMSYFHLLTDFRHSMNTPEHLLSMCQT